MAGKCVLMLKKYVALKQKKQNKKGLIILFSWTLLTPSKKSRGSQQVSCQQGEAA